MSGLGEILANGGLTAGEVGGVKRVRTYSRRAGSCFPTLAPQGWGTHIHGDALGGPPAVFVLIRGGLVRAFPPLLRKDGAPTFTEMLWVGHPPPGYFHLVEELRRNGTLRQHLFYASYGLSGALFVFYEAESYMSVAVVAEAYSWGHGYFGFGE